MHTAAATQSTPVSRLAASRAQLVSQMTPREAGKKTQTTHGFSQESFATARPDSHHPRDSGLWQLAKSALAGWWQHHPLQIAVDVARPYLGDYARNKPLQLLGLGMGLGVLTVVFKPWRLTSVTGLAAMAIKSTNLPVTLLSFMSRSVNNDPSVSTQQTSKDPQ